MIRWSALWRRVGVPSAAVVLSLVPVPAYAQDDAPARRLGVKIADPAERGDGTMSPAAAAALAGRPLPYSAAEAVAKAALNRTHAHAPRPQAARPAGPSDSAPFGGMAPAKTPAIVGGVNFDGLSDPGLSPANSSGAIGPTRYFQVVDRRAGIFNRVTGSPIAAGTLSQLANVAASVPTFQAQTIWDATTNRFYYIAVSVYSAEDNRLSFGFSKTASPTDLTTSWCKYQLQYGGRFPDYPRLGDSQYFLIVGSNIFGSDPIVYFNSEIMAVSKPPSGTGCPAAASFKLGFRAPLRDETRASVFSPVPANQIDTNPIGYVIARERFMPGDEFWFYSVVRDPATGAPNIQGGRRLAVPTFSAPPDAAQPTFSQLLETLDGRLTQALQAFNPQRGTFSFWTHHTIAVGPRAGVRWYEIDPVPAAPVMLRRGTITLPGSFVFNAAISPDRRVDGATALFGSSFVINYNVSSRANNIAPRIMASSSVSGGALQSVLVKTGSPYRDLSCLGAGSTCPWGDFNGASPDPRPPAGRPIPGRGVVWGTMEYSAPVPRHQSTAPWRTRIFQLQP